MFEWNFWCFEWYCNGKPLLQLLTKYGSILNEYGGLLHKLLNGILPQEVIDQVNGVDGLDVLSSDAAQATNVDTVASGLIGDANGNGNTGGNSANTNTNSNGNTSSAPSKLASPGRQSPEAFIWCNPHANKTSPSHLIHLIWSTPKIQAFESLRGTTDSNPNQRISLWKAEKMQYVIVYGCMILNTCRKTRELIDKLEILGKEELNSKFRSILNFSRSKEIFLTLEEEILNVIRIIILIRFKTTLFNFSKHDSSWDSKKYSNYLADQLEFYFKNFKKLLTDTTVIRFLKLFCAYFALKLYNCIVYSRNSNHNVLDEMRTRVNSGLIDLPNLFEARILHELPSKQASSMRVLQSHVSNCMALVNKITEIACAPAGDKYRKSDLKISKMNNNNSNNRTKTNLFVNYLVVVVIVIVVIQVNVRQIYQKMKQEKRKKNKKKEINYDIVVKQKYQIHHLDKK